MVPSRRKQKRDAACRTRSRPACTMGSNVSSLYKLSMKLSKYSAYRRDHFLVQLTTDTTSMPLWEPMQTVGNRRCSAQQNASNRERENV